MWCIGPLLTACIASGKLILLDEARDRYFGLPATLEADAIAWLRSADGSPVPPTLGALLGNGAALRNDQFAIPPSPIPGGEGGRVVEIGIGQILSVGLAVVLTWTRLRLGALHATLATHRTRRTTGAILGAAQLRHRAAIFRAARRWVPLKPHCLLDSLSLDRWLGSPRDAMIVFGVLARPFEAHSWVQSGGHVLNDSYDRVSRFEPILLL